MLIKYQTMINDNYKKINATPQTFRRKITSRIKREPASRRCCRKTR